MPRPASCSARIGGFTTFLANAGGPAWQMHLLPQKLDKYTYAGTLTMLFAASQPGEAAGLRRTRPADRGKSRGRRVAAAGGDRDELRSASGWCGARSTELFFRIAYVLMFLIAVELIRSSLTELL